MSDYRRNYVPGGTYFFTVVTDERRCFLTTENARGCLRRAFQKVKTKHPFQMDAIVLLPEHLHCIWSLPNGDDEYSTRWGLVKEVFTRNYLKAGGRENVISENRRRHRYRGIWQLRFWEHTVRDERDYERCFDYIHWNPVKHGLVSLPREYPWSSFHRYVAMGFYDPNWGAEEVVDIPGAEWE